MFICLNSTHINHKPYKARVNHTYVKKCKLSAVHILTGVLNEATLTVNIIYKNQTGLLVHSSNAMSINKNKITLKWAFIK